MNMLVIIGGACVLTIFGFVAWIVRDASNQ